jgi:hypothetical protein
MKKLAAVVVLFALGVGAGTFAGPNVRQAQQQAQLDTATEAKAMFARAVVAVKADKAKALAMFNNGEGGVKDHDLYPFCFGSRSRTVPATPAKNLIGAAVRALTGQPGKPFEEGLYRAAQRDTVTEISYILPRRGTDTTPVEKTSFVTQLANLGYGVGYYKSDVQGRRSSDPGAIHRCYRPAFPESATS